MKKKVTLRRADNSVIRVYAGRSKDLSDSFMLGQPVRVPDIGNWPDWLWDEEIPKSIGRDGRDAFKGCRVEIEDVPDPVKPLAEVKLSYKQQIDARAEDTRLKFITGGAGQALEYREVVEEAQRYALDPNDTPFPLLQASVYAGEADGLAAAAALVLGRYDAWKTVGAVIREVRIRAKRDIDAAASVAAVKAICDAIVWPK